MALDGVDLDVRPGEVHALIGENGAGKTTLMNLLAGAFPPGAGRMRLDGRDYAPRDAADARRHGVAHIHQELSLCPHLSVAENVLLGAEPARRGMVDFRRMEQRAAKLLAELRFDRCSDVNVGEYAETMSVSTPKPSRFSLR